MVESLTDLPSNILLEILIRLPLKTLFASRCICKTFLSLTTPNPHFIALHSSNAGQTLILQFGDVFKPSPLLRLFDPELDTDFVEISRLRPIFRMPKLGRSSVNHYRSSFREENKFVLVNSCGGLLYFVTRHAPNERSLVCNPVTNEYIMIPDFDVGTRTMSMWLGFSPGSNQYKLLRIFTSVYGEPAELGAQLLVFGCSSWRDIKHIPPLGRDYSWDTCSTFLNGVIYWLDQSCRDIIFFDFEREMFGEIVLPPEFGGEQLSHIHHMSIGVLGGCLSVSYNDHNAQHVDIWVKKKHGDQESWSKEITVDTGRSVYGRLKPLQVLRNGEIVMLWISHDMVCYNPKTKSLRFVGFDLLRLNPKAVAFTPSLVSLKETLLVDKVLVQYVRPRGDETAP